MRYIEFDDLLGYNAVICEAAGELSTVLNRSNLLSALGVPYSYFDTDEETASAVFRSLIIGHGFVDGNKRTAVMYILDVLPPNISDEDLEHITLQIATGRLRDVAEIVGMLYG